MTELRKAKEQIQYLLSNLTDIANIQLDSSGKIPHRVFLIEEKTLENRIEITVKYQQTDYTCNKGYKEHIIMFKSYDWLDVIGINQLYQQCLYDFLRYTLFAITSINQLKDSLGNNIDVYSIQDLIKKGL